MKNILIHGLGQDSRAWSTVKSELERKEIPTITPDLFELVKGNEISYPSVFQAFSKMCGAYQERLNLCGLSLGGLLALDYAIQHPARINSLVLIGTPYEVPKRLLKIQNFIFQFMPQSAFRNMGCSKKDFIRLSHSMAHLDFMKSAAKLDCPALILCGKRDKANMKSAKHFHEVMSNNRLIVVEGSGHEVNRDAPHPLARILQDFWAIQD